MLTHLGAFRVNSRDLSLIRRPLLASTTTLAAVPIRLVLFQAVPIHVKRCHQRFAT
jgi:hypothetical protein